MSQTELNQKKAVEHIRSNRMRMGMVIFIRYILPVIVFSGGLFITLHLMQSGPQAKPMPARKTGVAVETATVSFGSYPTNINAMGVVKAARSTDLKPQVSGQVISLSDRLVPGGKFTKGDTMLQLDPADFKLLLKQQENGVIQANNDLVLEKGNQLVVQREFDLLGEQVSEAEKQLMLRQPQLSSLQTALTIAQAKQQQAELDLKRTTITAPFNGIVKSREINVGTWVSNSTTLVTLIGSDSYWVEVSVPEDQLQWIKTPSQDGEGSLVRIHNPTAWGEGIYRQGRVIQVLPGLETQGRMARLLIEVNDPLAMDQVNQNKPKLLIDSFVRVVIEGKPITRAVELSRQYLHDGSQVWVYSEEGTLKFREVAVGFKNREEVLITSGLAAGDEVITSNISTPVEGLALRRLGTGNRMREGRKPEVLAMTATELKKGAVDGQ